VGHRYESSCGRVRQHAAPAFPDWRRTLITIARKPNEFQAIAISRIDFVDWTFRKAPARVTLSVPFFGRARCELRCSARGPKGNIECAR
jgi:hypothetical protein